MNENTYSKLSNNRGTFNDTCNMYIKGRFLKFQRYHKFANLFSKLLETTFYKEISKFHQKV